MNGQDPTISLTLEPIRTVDLTGLERAVDLTVTGDGSTAYVLETRLEVDVWDAVLRGWPWFAGAVLIVVLVWLSWRLVQTWRRARATRGEPFCRGCGYQLTGVSGATCPECGKAIEAGDRTRRPLLPVMRMMLLVSGVYCVTVIAATLGPVRGAVTWRSQALMDRLQSKSVGVIQFFPFHAIQSVRVHRVDLAGRSLPREVWRGDEAPAQHIVMGDADDEVVLLDFAQRPRVLHVVNPAPGAAPSLREVERTVLVRHSSRKGAGSPLHPKLLEVGPDGRWYVEDSTRPGDVRVWSPTQDARMAVLHTASMSTLRSVHASTDTVYVLGRGPTGEGRLLVFDVSGLP